MSTADLWNQIATLSPAKRELLERLLEQQGLSATMRGRPAAELREPPRNPLERTLAGLWGEVLGVEAVGIHDDFFSLGGDSIHCMQIVARARRAGLGLTARQLFENPTVARLATVAVQMSAADPASSPGAVPFADAGLSNDDLASLLASFPPGDAEDVYVLSPVQEGMLFHVLASSDPQLYRDQGVCTLSGALEPEAFRRAWRQLIVRHPALRTTFHWDGLPRSVQVVHRAVEPPIDWIDARELAPGAADALVEELRRDELARPMALAEPPLFRLTLVDLGGDDHRLLWTHHHLAHDAWSLNLLVGELLSLYQEERGGGQARLAPAPHYRRYLSWLRGHDPDTLAGFWRHALKGVDRPTRLPGDRGRPGDAPGDFQQREAFLPAADRELVEGFSRPRGLTVATLVQAAWALELASAAGTGDVVLGAVVAGRPLELPESEAVVGLFINTLPLRLAVPADRPLGAWLREVQAAGLALREHEQTPLARIQAWTAVERGVPLFESVVVVQNVFLGLPRKQETDLGVDDMRLYGHSNYPLMLRATPGERFRLELLFDSARFLPADGDRLLARCSDLLVEIARGGEERTVGDLLAFLSRRREQELAEDRATWRLASRERLRATRRATSQEDPL